MCAYPSKKPRGGKPGAGKPAAKQGKPAAGSGGSVAGKGKVAAGQGKVAAKQGKPAAKQGKPASKKQPVPRASEADFLPMTREAALARGWEELDFVYVSGDAYVDHPSFGPAIIGRLLESRGYRVGIIAQPDWNDPQSIAVLGEPRLAFLVSAGNMDSMVNHYTVAKKRRSQDAYTPGGEMGKRPNHAAVVYSNLIRRTFKTTPIVLGGIEASLRRMAHYDYWSDKLKRSILLDSGADLVSYGMGERSIVEIADALASGLRVQDLTFIAGTAYRTNSLEHVYDFAKLPSWDEINDDKMAFARSFAVQHRNNDSITGKVLVEPYPNSQYVVVNPPQPPLSTSEMDAVYRLPFARTWHPSYDELGGVPAFSEVKFSLTSSRGCFGECSFCALAFHQGRTIQARSHESLVEEAKLLTEDPEFKGYIHDVGGPTANFRIPSCKKQLEHGVCSHKHCLWPKPCKQMKVSHSDYVGLLRKLRALPGVKKVFVRSGIRFDYLMADSDRTFLRELCEHHVSGQLKVAPEHVSKSVLASMGKPAPKVYRDFAAEYKKVNEELGKDQYLVPYLMSSHPGSGWAEAIELAEFCRDMGYNPEQVQDFYPTPSTVSTCMYYTGVNPLTMEPVYVPKSPHEKALQRALIQYRNPKNHDLVREALHKAGREDLIGYEERCLVRPAKAGNAVGPAKRADVGNAAGAGKRAALGNAAGAGKRAALGNAAGPAKRAASGNAAGPAKRAASSGSVKPAKRKK